MLPPSAKCTALGEGPITLGEAFPECNTRGRASGGASHGEEAFPSVVLALGEDLTPSVPSVFLKKLFPECNTRERNLFFKSSSPSVILGKEILFFFKILFPKCSFLCTRGRMDPHFFQKKPSPSAPA
jgi:hypothetical protein